MLSGAAAAGGVGVCVYVYVYVYVRIAHSTLCTFHFLLIFDSQNKRSYSL